MELSYEWISRNILERYEQNIYNYADEYGEPGYSHNYGATTPTVLLGDYWCRCGTVLRDDGTPDLHDIAHHHPRVWAQLESQGVQCEWSDEWIVSYGGDASRAYRTQPDSYSWQPSILWTDGDFLTPDDGIDAWLEECVNDPQRCISSHVWTRRDMEAAGFVQWEPDDPHTYENGWHPGQTDDPKTIDREIRERMGNDVEVVFYLDATGQFDIRFSAWMRGELTDDQSAS